ncbi:MAG: hypothetical protein IIB38_13060 [Candidatus Hydrogenedentes bacterium]|nr:hypothetical protein [Candidatus Hydrogenedentota bacterium]
MAVFIGANSTSIVTIYVPNLGNPKGPWAINADIILPGLNDMMRDRRNYHIFEMRMILDYGPPFLNGTYPLLEYRNQAGKLGMGVATAKLELGRARLLSGFAWALVCHG